MKYYIVVKMEYVGELYDVSGPYNSYEQAEDDLDVQHSIWSESMENDEYLSIVPRKE